MDRAAEGVGCACEREGQEFGLGGLITITMGAAKKKKRKKRTHAVAGLSCSHLFQ